MTAIAASSFPGTEDVTRRDFLNLTTVAVGTVGIGMAASALVQSMNPAEDILSAGNPVDIPLGSLAPGQQIIIVWRGNPVFIVRRSPQNIDSLQRPSHLARLRDPDSLAPQQPKYANNPNRSVKTEYVVLVGICTHLGCIPTYRKDTDTSVQTENWPGGYLCACHGSKYDLAGRVFKGVPAPYNLPVPPHHYVSDTLLRVGENPPGENFDIASIAQI